MVNVDGSSELYLYNSATDYRQYGGLSMQFDTRGQVYAAFAYTISPQATSPRLDYSFYWVTAVGSTYALNEPERLPPIIDDRQAASFWIMYDSNPDAHAPFASTPEFAPPRLIPFKSTVDAYNGAEVKGIIDEYVIEAPAFYILTTALLPVQDTLDPSKDMHYLHLDDQGNYTEVEPRMMETFVDEAATADSGILTLEGHSYFTLIPFHLPSATGPAVVSDGFNSLIGTERYAVNEAFVIIFPLS
jgi:hypothetical protein